MTTFTRRAITVSESDGSSTVAETTIDGIAMQFTGKPDTYRRLSLTESQAPMLFFTPTDYPLYAHTAEFVQVGDTVEWNGQTYTALDVDPFAPDGFVIFAYIVVQR